MPTADERIGRALVDQGVLSPPQLEDCLRELLRRRAKGAQAVLLDVLSGKGLATPERVAAALEDVGEIAFRCPRCRSRNVTQKPRADVLYSCKRCAVALEVDEAPAPPPVPEPTSPTLKAWVPEAPAPSRTLGKYRLDEELGRGGSAVVWKAWDSSLEQHVALKVMRRDAADAEEVEAFLREARLAARLSHPHIVRVFEVGRHDERPFISMELVQDGSLAALLRPGKGRGLPFYRDVPRFVRVLKQIAEALDHAHRQSPPIVHRDVKPSNILLHADGRACLADFGLAKETRGGAGRLTLDNVAKGTPCYMAPEQAKGGRGRIDARTDVWALGAVLYEALTGRPPFTGESELDILRKVVEQEPERPSDLLGRDGVRPAALPALERICLKALEKDPAKRYPSAGAFARDLAAFQSGRPVAARASGSSGRALKWVSKNKAVLIPSTAAVVFGIIALVALLRPSTSPPPSPPPVAAAPAPDEATEAAKRVREFRFGEALELYERAVAKTSDLALLPLYRARMTEARHLEAFLDGLVAKIRAGGRDVPDFRTRSETWSPARVTDATSQKIVVRAQGKLRDVPWADVDPAQLSQLAAEFWPDVAGPAALGLESFRKQHALPPPVAAPKPPDPAPVVAAPAPAAGPVVHAIYASGRRELVKSLRARDFVEAARIWMLATSDLFTAQGTRVPLDPTETLRKITATEIPAAELRKLLPDVEAWISRETSPDSIALRQAFDLRDLLVVATACADARSAMDRLREAKAEVVAPSLGARGVLAWGKEGDEIGGRPVHVLRGSGDRLRGRDLVALMAEDRRRSKATPDWRRRLGEALLRVYDGAPLAWTWDLEEWDAVEAGLPPAEQRKARLPEYRTILRTGGSWSLDLAAEPGLWTGDLEGPGLGLPHLDDAVAGTGKLAVPPGVSLEFRLRLVRPLPGSELVLGFSEGKRPPARAFAFLLRDEEAELRLGGRNPHVLGAPGGRLEFALDVERDETVLSIGGQAVAVLREGVGTGLGLRLAAKNVGVRIERLALRERPVDDVRPPAVQPEAEPQGLEEILKSAEGWSREGKPKDAAYFYSLAILRQPGNGELWMSRAHHLHDAGDWEAARSDLARAILLGGRNVEYARLYLWLVRARLGEGGPATAMLRASSRGRGVVTEEVAWTLRLAALLTGEATEDAVLEEARGAVDAKTRKERECEAYFYAGMKRLLEGERGVGEALLRRCVDTEVRNFIEWNSAKAELGRR